METMNIYKLLHDLFTAYKDQEQHLTFLKEEKFRAEEKLVQFGIDQNSIEEIKYYDSLSNDVNELDTKIVSTETVIETILSELSDKVNEYLVGIQTEDKHVDIPYKGATYRVVLEEYSSSIQKMNIREIDPKN